MANDMADVSFVCMVLIACGRNEIVVQQAASSPMAVIILLLIMAYKIAQRRQYVKCECC